jgi:hypothetical protein
MMIVSIFAGCAPAKKNPYYEKRMNAPRANASQLGRNRYYYSPSYQKKLGKSYKRK